MGSTHLKAYRNIPSAQIAAVASSSEKKLEGDLSEIQGNIGGPGEHMDFSKVRKYRTVEEAARDPEVEAVDICLPTRQHAPVAIEALRHGKHVLVEKPMALDGTSAEEMLTEADRSGRVLMVAQVLRFVPAYRAAADILQSRALGAVRSAIFRRRCAAPAWSKWLADKEQSGGGVFDLLIHDVDFCLHVLGRPDAVSAVGYEDLPKGVDWILAHFWYPGIGGVAITGGWHHPKAYPFSMEFTIVADGGTLEYNSSGKPLSLFAADGSEQVVPTPEGDFYQAEIEYFLECASQGRRPDRCPPEDSAAAVKLAHLMLESRSRNGEKIACNI
jgi:predicted dehydrogenase